jgi:hypothetical protein
MHSDNPSKSCRECENITTSYLFFGCLTANSHKVDLGPDEIESVLFYYEICQAINLIYAEKWQILQKFILKFILKFVLHHTNVLFELVQWNLADKPIL